MMTKLQTGTALAIALALAAAQPAAAQAIGGGDGVATYPVTASAADYCQLGRVGTTSGSNASINTANGATSDASVTVALQDANDHIQAWSAAIPLPATVCNHRFTITTSSDNGGLRYTGSESGNAPFTSLVPYNLNLTFEGITDSGAASTYTGAGRGANSTIARAGLLTYTLSGAANGSAFLLQGTYQDTLHVTLGAFVGG